MNKRALLAATAFSALMLATTANAADLAEPIPEAPVELWSGLHIGIGGGGAQNHTKARSYHEQSLSYTDDEQNSGALVLPWEEQGVNLGRGSGFGTIELGYDWQFSDTFVAGIMGNFDFGKGSWAKVAHAGGASFEGDLPWFDLDNPDDIQASIEAGAGFKVRRKNSWFIGGRLGYAATPATLIYGVLGYTQAKIQARGGYDLLTQFDDERVDFLSGEESFGGSKNRGGFTIGAGAETFLTENITAKLEYRYTDFKKWSRKDSFSFTECFDDCDIDVTFAGENGRKIDMNEHSVRAVVSWRMNLLN
jgi:opacity protein-like surface antigen